MDVVEFIENDVKREAKNSVRVRIGQSLAVFLLPLGLGLALRDSWVGVFEPRVFVPNLIAAMVLARVTLITLRRNQKDSSLALLLVLIFFAVFLATERMFFPVDLRTTYDSSTAFWHENAKCMMKGSFATAMIGILLSFFAFRYSSWPTRRWRAILALIAGVSGAVMLGFHCDSSNMGHVLIAHLGQGVAIGFFFFAAQEFYFYFKLRRLSGLDTGKIRRFYKIG